AGLAHPPMGSASEARSTSSQQGTANWWAAYVGPIRQFLRSLLTGVVATRELSRCHTRKVQFALSQLLLGAGLVVGRAELCGGGRATGARMIYLSGWGALQLDVTGTSGTGRRPTITDRGRALDGRGHQALAQLGDTGAGVRWFQCGVQGAQPV